jgi:hypothetical protein
MKKTYADVCLERAENATPGPWIPQEKIWSNQYADDVYFKYKIVVNKDKEKIVGDERTDDSNAEFIASSRSDVPELAKRLKRACEILREIHAHFSFASKTMNDLADELEAMPEDEDQGK